LFKKTNKKEIQFFPKNILRYTGCWKKRVT